MHGEPERDIKDVESEVCTGGEAAAGANAVFPLGGLIDIETEDAEREIDRNLRHHEDAKPRRICKAGFKISRVSLLQLSVVRPVEIRRTGGKLELRFVEDPETPLSRQADILRQQNRSGIRFISIHHVGNIEAHIFVDIEAEAVDVTANIAVFQTQTGGDVVAEGVTEIRLYRETVSRDVYIRDDVKHLEVLG